MVTAANNPLLPEPVGDQRQLGTGSIGQTIQLMWGVVNDCLKRGGGWGEREKGSISALPYPFPSGGGSGSLSLWERGGERAFRKHDIHHVKKVTFVT